MDSPKGINPAKQGGGGSPVIVAAKEANPLITSEKTENGFERVRLPFSCDNYDLEQVRKIAEALLSGLATACVEATYGDPFRNPESVAVKMRKEMMNYVLQESSTYPTVFALNSESAECPENPTDVVDDLIDNFVESQRSIFSRFSAWLLSEQREEKIDDFEEKLEGSEFWSKGGRERIAKELLSNIDMSKSHHCGMHFVSNEELQGHKKKCGLRRIRCENEGCMETLCAMDAVKHGAVCPLKVVPCEQKCPAMIVRDEMDRHCLTECPMRLVPCPFYQVGCQTSMPQESIAEHCAELLCSHIFYCLQMLHRNQSTQHLTQLAVLLEKSITVNERLSALDIGSLCRVVKEHETKIDIQKQEMGRYESAGDGCPNNEMK